MKFEDIYKVSIQSWPYKIDLNDAKLIEEINGLYSRNLSIAWDIAEQAATNEWESLMVWAIFQTLHKMATELFKRGKHDLFINAIVIPEVKTLYLKMLQQDEYQDMLKEFLKWNKTSNST